MVTNPNFKPGVGRLVTDRFDFERHIEGIDFRHQAANIIADPGIGSSTNVQDSLNNIAAFIAASAGSGQGFVTVGDGYDTWHAANGNTNFDPTISSLDLLLNPVFDAITNNTTVPTGFERIQRGGIIVIKAGTYTVNKTINVPPGITLIGEGYGTKIINISNLTITPLPPTPKTPVSVSNASNTSPIQITVSSPVVDLVTGDIINISGVTGNTAANNTWTVTVIDSLNFTLNGSITNGIYISDGSVITTKPIFKILPDNNRVINDSAVDPNLFMFSRETKIMNMVIADNFVENTILGDVYYKLPQNRTSSLFLNPPALIQQESGSNLQVSGVYLIGRANFSSGQTVNNITGYAISLDTTIPATTGTILKVNDCFVDGFAQPILFNSTAGSNDYIEISRCKIRGYGYLNGDNSSASNNCIVNTNICNIDVTDNYLYGNYDNMLTTIYLSSLPSGGAPIEQNKSRITVVSNNIAVNKLSGSTNETGYLTINTGLSSSNILAYASTFSHGNNINFDNKSAFRLYLDSSAAPQLAIDTSSISLQASGTGSNVTLQSSGTSSTATVQSAGTASLTSTAGAVTIQSATGASLISTGSAVTVQSSGTASLISTGGFTVISAAGGATTLIGTASGTTLNSINTTVQGQTLQLTGGSVGVFISSNSGSDIHINPAGTTFFSNPIKGDSYPLNFSLNSVALSTTTPVTLSSAQYNTQTIKFTGALSNDINVVFPNISGYAKLIDNSTTGNFNVLLGVSGQATPIAMYPGQKFWIYCDGTNIVKARNLNTVLAIASYTNGGINGLISTTTSASFTNSVVTASINGARSGDILYINGLISGSSSAVGQGIVTVTDGSTTDLTETTLQFANTAITQLPVVATRTLSGSNSFTVTATIRFRSNSGGDTTDINTPASLVIQLIRP